MSLHLDLDPHYITSAEPGDPDTRPEGLVVGHPLVKVPHHGRQRAVVQRDVVRVDAKDLLPALAAGLLENVVDIGKGLVDLVVNVLVDHAGLVDPAAWCVLCQLLFPDLFCLLLVGRGEGLDAPWPEMWRTSPTRTTWLYL